MKDKKLANKRSCLILGGTSEIGLAIANKFAENGFDLILAARNYDEVQKNANNINLRFNVKTDALKMDILDVTSQNKLIDELQFLPDIVVFSIGLLDKGKTAEENFEIAKEIIDVNFTYSLNILNKFAALFEARKFGAIIGIGSVAGDRGRKSNYIYGSAKAAFATYLSGLRNRLFQSNVRVITVKPGFVQTKMVAHLDLPKIITASPEKIAKDVYKAFVHKKDIVYSLKFYKLLMLIVYHIPEILFKRINL